MWHFVLTWCRSWRRRDVLMSILASAVMVVGMAALVGQGAWVLAPLLPGIALLWGTPLAKYPFDLRSADFHSYSRTMSESERGRREAYLFRKGRRLVPLLVPRHRQIGRNITCSPTGPSCGCRKPPGTVPRIVNPSDS